MFGRKRDFAREVRKGQTDYEQFVWEQLRNRRCEGLKFRRQHVLEGFVVDFYCHDIRLAIELDGCAHDSRKNYDELRDEEIKSDDVRIIRITNDEIDKDELVAQKRIRKYLDGLKM